MKVLVVGADGRSHALAWRLKQCESVSELFIAPGNPGSRKIATPVDIGVNDIAALTAWAKHEGIDLTVVSPEEPLSRGIVDTFRNEGLRIFGPTKSCARLESSKEFSKKIMVEAGVPTPKSMVCEGEEEVRRACREHGVPVVLKSDGLAAGKGVVVCKTEAEVDAGISFLCGELGATRVLVEECLIGVEASFIIASDGERIVPFPTSHDYKRIFDGNEGPNTGGMGAISPTPFLSADQEQFVIDRIVAPVLKQMKERGDTYLGFLYAGLMIPSDGMPRVIEFNCRFGDPECQPVMRRVEGDLALLLTALCDGTELPPLPISNRTAVCIVHAAERYPASPTKGDVISGIDNAEEIDDVVVFQAGTRETSAGQLVTDGGRVLAVTALGTSVEDALEKAYAGSDKISFRGRQLRRDIGAKNG